ncbi:MAG: UbiA prenyltransferase family protein [Clostridia bacterium]|nr:UbiA prenyltransferase family protein [Clostridia bacterium]
MKKYIRIMRLDHWIKQFFIVPGCICAIILADIRFDASFIFNIIAGFFATCLIASSNYVINEYLDAKFDKFHPTKKHRSVVSEGVDAKIVWILWAVLAVAGFVLGSLINVPFLMMEIFLWVMGILYNVKPFRTKDIAILDVLSESVNNAIRLLMGWFIFTETTLPPSSIILGYWMGGAFLMATKRYSEYRMINNPELAGSYRKSFKFYTEKSLLLSAFYYAMLSVFFVGIFLIKYRIELVLIIPVLIGLFSYYFYISFKADSAAQKPEKLYREKGLMLYVLFFILAFSVLAFVDMPWLDFLTTHDLIHIK